MQRIELIWVIFEAQATDPADRARAAIRDATLESLLSRTLVLPWVSLNLHLTGNSLERLKKERPELVVLMREAGARGQLELLVGGMSAPILSAIPEIDAASQLTMARQWSAMVSGGEANGAWLTGLVWSPSVVPLLARAGLRFTFLERAQLAAGTEDGSADGPRCTERLGHRLTLIPLDPELPTLFMAARPTGLQATLAARIPPAPKGAHRPATFGSDPLPVEVLAGAQSLDELGGENGCLEALHAAFERLQSDSSWLRLRCASSIVAGQPSRGMVYLGDCLPARLATVLKAGGPDGDADVTKVPWERFLMRYPEAMLLQKRVLYGSARLQNLGRVLLERHQAGEDVVPLAQAIDRAQRALFDAQDHAAYWPAPGGSLYQPVRRSWAWSRLLEIHRVLDAVMRPEPAWVRLEQLDLDRDGNQEILVSNPRLECCLQLEGGAMVDLSFKPLQLPLQAVLTRRSEPFHEMLPSVGVAPVSRRRSRGREDSPPNSPPAPPTLRYDRHPRATLLDHILGPGTTLENFSQCQYLERGDFLSSRYEIVRADYDRRSARGRVHLSRNGYLQSHPDDNRHPLRVEKCLELDDRVGEIRVRYLLSNRAHTPVTLLFGTEFVFGSLLEPLGAWTGAAPFPVPTDAPTLQMHPGMAELRGQLHDARGLALQAARGSLQVRLEWDLPATLWWFGIETLSRTPDGLDFILQGRVFLPHWEVALWGEESRELELFLRIHEPDADLLPEIEVEDEDS